MDLFILELRYKRICKPCEAAIVHGNPEDIFFSWPHTLSNQSVHKDVLIAAAPERLDLPLVVQGRRHVL